MITTLSSSILRISVFWYLAGVLVIFFGDPDWAEALYRRLQGYPGVPGLDMKGLATAAEVQWHLVAYWTVPLVALWLGSMLVGVVVAEVQCQIQLRRQHDTVKPAGQFWGVFIPRYSLGQLPAATTPGLIGEPVHLGSGRRPGKVRVDVQGAMHEAVKCLTDAERQLAEELLQLLLQAPNHYAGLGHGVGLLEHTLNVTTEAAAKVTPEFRMPLLAALAHDVGKLITFQPDGQGGWRKKGLHSRESARILATLPGFQALPEVHQRALLLAVKYDHAPQKMPELRGERDACTLALRIINALAQADRKATADEKDRHLERLKPEDLLWQDFVDFLREAPVVQRGKPGVANQVNNPPDSAYLFLYETPWREAAVRRLPPEVAAALDLSRRDAGKVAKYTRILVERLRKEGVLVEAYQAVSPEGTPQELRVSENNPLWDIQSGVGEKAVVLRGILVLKADELWKKLNYRLSIKSPYPVQILAPNADASGRVNEAPHARHSEASGPEVSDSIRLSDLESPESLATVGLGADPTSLSGPKSRPKTRARSEIPAEVKPPASESFDFGLDDKPSKPAARRVVNPVADAPPAPKAPEHDRPAPAPKAPPAEPTAKAPPATDRQPIDGSSSHALDQALAYLQQAPRAPAQPELEPASSAENQDTAAYYPSAVDDSSQPRKEAGATALAKESLAAESPRVAPLAPEASQAPLLPPVPNRGPTRSEAQREGTHPPVVANGASKPAQPKPAPAPVADKSTPAPSAPGSGIELSRAEKREGLAIADEAAVAQYPHLSLGSKYYTQHSRAVREGLKKPGSRYKGDAPDKVLALSENGPLRSRRKIS